MRVKRKRKFIFDNNNMNNRRLSFFYFFLIKKFNRLLLKNMFDKWLKFRNSLFKNKFRSFHNDLFFYKNNEKFLHFWRLLKFKLNIFSDKSMVFWIKRRYGIFSHKNTSKKVQFIWRLNPKTYISFKVKSFNQFKFFPRFQQKSFFVRKHMKKNLNVIQLNWRKHKHKERIRRRRFFDVIYLKPKGVFSRGNIRIPLYKPRDLFFSKRQLLLRFIRKFIFSLKASTGFLYFNYNLSFWNDRIFSHFKEQNFSKDTGDFFLEETIVNRMNNLFINHSNLFSNSNLVGSMSDVISILNYYSPQNFHTGVSYLISHSNRIFPVDKNFFNLFPQSKINLVSDSELNYFNHLFNNYFSDVPDSKLFSNC